MTTDVCTSVRKFSDRCQTATKQQHNLRDLYATSKRPFTLTFTPLQKLQSERLIVVNEVRENWRKDIFVNQTYLHLSWWVFVATVHVGRVDVLTLPHSVCN